MIFCSMRASVRKKQKKKQKLNSRKNTTFVCYSIRFLASMGWRWHMRKWCHCRVRFPHMHRRGQREKIKTNYFATHKQPKARQKKHKLDAQKDRITRLKTKFVIFFCDAVNCRREETSSASSVCIQFNFKRRHISHELKNEKKNCSLWRNCLPQVLVNRLKWQHKIVRCVQCSCEWTCVRGAGARGEWMGIATLRTSHKFFRHWAISPVDGNGWHSSGSRRTGRAEQELKLLRSLLRWRSWNEFSCAHTFTNYSLRSFVIPKSKAEAEERSSRRIHPIQCLLQCFCRHRRRRRCCYWKQLKGNVAQREVIFHWVNGLWISHAHKHTLTHVLAL